MKKILFILISFCFLSCDIDNKKANDTSDNILTDTIFYGKTKNGIPKKTIYYESKKIDSFKLRSRYEDGKLIDSMFISEKGYLFGKSINYLKNGIRRESEYLTIDGKNFLNQHWMIKKNDTLDYGNNFHIRTTELNKNGDIQIEIILRMSNYKDFSNLFFLYPKDGNFQKLNSNFSNYKEIQYDTIQNLAFYEKDLKVYDEYWSKRSIVFNMNFKNKKYLRGILIERKDTSFIDSEKNKIKFIDRYLFINKKIANHK
ncbi:hypothetical protein [Kordia jejudonensis]|uniref:hypothetical protein n=1 Tax=Kordia jejudonensis TaxID=1348245 RepID=UPI00062926B3|nr:hypothetical protein [Kordia jejudonensis]